MGIVFKQSLKNTIIIYVAFAIGGINALFLYTRFLTDEYYGLVTYLLSTANILMPLTAFGVQYTIVKFFSSYNTKIERDNFLNAMLFLPLFIAIPMAFVGNIFYESISNYLSLKNSIIKNYTFVIFLVALFTAYFEIFYAWSKVQMQSVFGNLMKELYNRVVVMLLLFAVYFNFIPIAHFIYYLTAMYFVRMLIMMLYAFSLYLPKFSFQLPKNYKEILKYAAFIILAGSAGSIVLDIDKFMIPQQKAIAQTAYYAVAVYIGSVIEAPGRAMSHILQPLTAKAINENNMVEVASLYKRSSINLLLVSGFIFLLINANIAELYKLIPSKYAGGILVVLMISIVKLYHMFIGNNGAIIANSKYYKILLPYAISMSIMLIVLNRYFINSFGINGAALATLVVILLYNTIKVWYVHYKFGILPFTNKTGLLLVIIVLLFFAFYFWDFSFHPLINIALKSCLLGLIYSVLVVKLHISEDINAVLSKFIKID